jgi:PAS domain S-box-containing protein
VARLAAEAAGLPMRAIEWLPSGVLILGPDGTIAVVNRELERQFGYAREELIGQSVDVLLPESLRLAHAAHRAGFMTGPVARRMGAGRNLLGSRRDGSQFPVEVSLKPIQTEHGTFVLAVVDTTAPTGIDNQGNRLATAGRIEFEKLVAELFVKFINLPADQVLPAIQDALRRIGEGLDLDRCSFYRIQPDGMLVDAVTWVRQGFPLPPAPVPAAESFPWALEMMRSGRLLCFSRVDEVPNPIDRESFRSFGIQSAVIVPLSVEGRIVGATGFNMMREPRLWHPETVHRLSVLAAAFGQVLARQRSDEALQMALTEVVRLRDQLQAENVYLRREVQDRFGGGNMVGQSAAVQRVLAQVQQVAPADSTVLLLGETGTGKELFATRIHELSGRRGRPMVRVNCAAIPATLIESELFGREKGAFTGALARQIGRFEVADHSTIFLDEIGDLPAEVQVKLLRVLEQRQIERLGSPKAIRVDARIIAATHRNLEQRIADGMFREDLFYRLNVFPIHVPPLRERVEDIPLLVARFVDEFSKSLGKRIDTIPGETVAALQEYPWPGNIRELRNIVERAMIEAKGSRLTIAVPAPTNALKHGVKLADVEKEHIRGVLEATGWRIRGSGGAADRLGLRPTTLETRMAKLGLSRPKR